MIFFTSLVLTAYISRATCIEVSVDRRTDYDQLFHYDGDCSEINGIRFFITRKWRCTCKFRGLYGTIFLDGDGFLTCLYGHSKTG